MRSPRTSVTRRTVLSTALGSVTALAMGPQSGTAVDTTNDDLSIPDNPYIVTAHGAPLFSSGTNLGWSFLDKTERIQLIRGVHPDLMDFRRLIWIEDPEDGLPPRAAQQAEFTTREGIAGTSGQTIYVNADPEEAEQNWGWVRTENDWHFPNGDPVENPTGLFAERFDGSTHGYGVQNNGIGIPSVFAPGTLDILMMGAREAFDRGFSAMFLDSTTTPRLQGLDFSPWAQAAFRDHLATLSEERLDELGVTDPSTLDVREAFRNRSVTPSDDVHPATDPLYRAYLLFHHRGLQALLAAYKERIDTEFPDRPSQTTMLYGNQYIGDEFGNSPAAALHVSEVLDFINIEDNRTLPPDTIREPAYKLMSAAAKGEKPVLFEGQMHDQPGSAQTLRGLDPTKRYHTLQRLQLSEAYANGVPRKLPLTSWGNIHADDTVTHWVEKDGSIPNDLQTFADFLWVNEGFLRTAKPDNNVAVVCSLPTLLWERAPEYDIEPDRHLDAFRGVCTLLRESRIPYDVTIFGHEQLYDDSSHLESLDDYDAVILPGITSVADRHVDALESVANKGVTVVTSANVPERDSFYRPREPDWLTSDVVTNLSDDPGLVRLREGTTTSSLANALDGIASVTLEGPDTIAVNRLCTNNPKTVQLHLINYAYDSASDTVATARNVKITIPDMDIEPTGAAYITPSVRVDLDIQRTNNGVTLTVPRLDEWGFVVFADDSETLSPSGNEPEARDNISELQTRIDQAQASLNSPSVWPSLARAQVFLKEAQTAQKSGVYDKAVSRATAGLSSVESLSAVIDPDSSSNSTNASPSSSNETVPATEGENQNTTATDTSATSPGLGVLSGLLGIGAGTALGVWREMQEDAD